jgi:hypothetical protein
MGKFHILLCVSSHSLPHVPKDRLLAVVISDDLLLTPEEFAHLTECKECLERWRECMEEAGRRLEQDD